MCSDEQFVFGYFVLLQLSRILCPGVYKLPSFSFILMKHFTCRYKSNFLSHLSVYFIKLQTTRYHVKIIGMMNVHKSVDRKDSISAFPTSNFINKITTLSQCM